MSTSGECRAHAAACLRLAQTAVSQEQKTILSDLAREWEEMAKPIARAEVREAKERTKNSVIVLP